MAIVKSMKVRPVPGSALFVANKWDKLQEEEEIRKGAIKNTSTLWKSVCLSDGEDSIVVSSWLH